MKAGRITAWLVLFILSSSLYSADFDYRLKPEKIAEDTYVFIGKTEDFSRANGGNVVNTGFIVTSGGVVVIDSGPSKRYAQQMRAAIAKITQQPIVKVFNTHAHPDHFLGNAIYADAEIAASAETIKTIAVQGNAFSDNLYRMSGEWMAGTEAFAPSKTVAASIVTVGDHALDVLIMKGHTAGDLAIFDKTTSVLFTGDLVFFNRALTTPHADIDAWLATLTILEKLPFKTMVPGHGPVVNDNRALKQTRAHLLWLTATLNDAVARGADMTEVLATPIARPFSTLPLADSEFQRSVAHLYPKLEAQALPNRSGKTEPR